MLDLTACTATQLRERLQTSATTCQKIIEAHLARIQDKEDTVGAWIFLDPAYARAQAKQLDSEGRLASLPLGGIPIGIKDIFNTRDMPTSMGSAQWEGFTPGNDARVVHYLRMAGAIFPGKTVTAEFAVHTPGKTVNPLNPCYSPGTSSSGSAAAVASQMVPCALGTQTAGSIMRPASYCGCWGFKPSFGLLPRTGVLKTVDTLDSIGMFARDPRDLRLLFDVMRVRGANFPISDAVLNDHSRQKRGARPWRVALIPDLVDKFSQPYARDAFFSLVNRLKAHPEIEVVERRLDSQFYEIHDIHSVIYNKSLSYYFQREFGEDEGMSLLTKRMIEQGKDISTEQYQTALARQRALQAMFDVYSSECDVTLILSTQGIAPLLHQEDIPDTCLIWTFCGASVVGVPAFLGPNAMPFGLQVVGRRYNDYLVLDFCDFLATHFRPFEGELYDRVEA